MVGRDRLDMVLNQLPEDHPAILLAHEPDFANVSGPLGRFGLQLSGHSHGTQMVLPRVGTLIRGPHFRDYPIGRYDVHGMTLYTNRGLGTNVFWMRFNCPPEIAVITLSAA
jgi:predicted MPP superfamily phosphohydrolase